MVSYLLECCDAMTPAFQELDRIKAELEAAAEAEQEKQIDPGGTD